MTESVEVEFTESLKLPELSDITNSYLELGLNQLFTDSLLEDIPIVRTLAALEKAGNKIRDHYFVKKLLEFLNQLGRASPEQRREFLEEQCHDHMRLGETILHVIEQAENREKAALIGKIFRAHIEGAIGIQDPFKMAAMVNRALWEDLRALFETPQLTINEHNQSLVNAGLFNLGIRGGGLRARYSPANLYYDLNEYGRKLIEIAAME